jgi:DUF917 family protein
MGRAFPELQMVTFTLGGISATPMAMVDEKGNGCTFDTISNVWTEKLARAITIQMGGSAMCSLYPVTAKQCKDYLIRGSLSLIHHIGNIIEKHSFNAYQLLVKELNGKHLFQGRVRDVERRSEGGWNRGIVKLEGTGEFVNRDAKIDFQNEFLVAMEGDAILATTPDLICVFDANTGAKVTAETIKYGLSCYWSTCIGIKHANQVRCCSKNIISFHGNQKFILKINFCIAINKLPCTFKLNNTSILKHKVNTVLTVHIVNSVLTVHIVNTVLT